MKDKIKVAQIIGRTLNGGVENLILNYYLNIDRSKVEFDFFVEKECDMINSEKISALGGKVILIPSYKHIFRYTKCLKKIFEENEYDIVQANLNALSVFPLRAAKKAKIKCRVANSLSTSNRKEFIRNFIKNVLRRFSKLYATHYFACSDLCGTRLYGKNILNNDKYYKINNAIEETKYTYNPLYRNELIAKHNLENKLVIGNIGRLENQKNQMFLLDVFKCIKEKKPSSSLILIGDGTLYSSLRERACNLGVSNDVIILTSKEVGVRDSALKYYSVFDYFVLPSLYEGLPTVGIEAQISDLPCFFSNTITKETTLFEKCKYLSLKDGPEKRADEILSYKIKERNNRYCKDYDSGEQGKKLLEIYNKIYKEIN